VKVILKFNFNKEAIITENNNRYPPENGKEAVRRVSEHFIKELAVNA
jgi:hypothetical protein